jgi:hypothetical protein
MTTLRTKLNLGHLTKLEHGYRKLLPLYANDVLCAILSYSFSKSYLSNHDVRVVRSVYMLSQDSSHDDLLSIDFDLEQIFIGREAQLEQFSFYLERWRRFALTTTDVALNTAPSPRDRIRGLVVLLHGRGGFGKSTLLNRYHETALEYYQELKVSKIVDWEFAAQERPTLFNPAPREKVDALAYFNFLRDQLADKLNKKIGDFKQYQEATKTVEDARKQVVGVLDSLRQDNRYSWLGGWPVR